MRGCYLVGVPILKGDGGRKWGWVGEIMWEERGVLLG